MTLARVAVMVIVLLLIVGLVPLSVGAAGEGGDRPLRLTRDLQHAKIGGVCAGIANYFSIDVSIVRIGWVIFTLAGGAGLLAYLICWVVVPPGA